MRVAFVSTFYPFRGGIAQFNAALYRALEQQYHVQAFNFTVQYPKALFPGKTQLVTDDDKADPIPSRRVINSVNPASYRKTVNEILKFNPDLVIIGYWMPFMAPSLGFVAGRLRKHCKVVSIVHNAVPHEQSKLDRSLSNYFFKKNDAVMTLSESVKNDLVHQYPHLRIETVLHPTYNHFGRPISREQACFELELDSSRSYLLFFGLIRDYKGLDVLIETLACLPEDIELIIAGETYGSFEKYAELIARFKLKARIHHFDQYIPDQEVHRYFSAADYCVLPYKSATQSGITAISLEMNTPVIATDVGGLSEFIHDGKNGFLVPADAPPKVWADKIQAVMNLETRDKLQQTMKESLPPNWKEFADQLISFIFTPLNTP
jgi:glycosyltransferase involved in cell wall biosynthesis